MIDPDNDGNVRSHSASHRHLPGEPGIWVMVFSDMIVFSIFFATFLAHRAENVEIFERSRAEMERGYGLLNTVLLLTSSWLVAEAVSRVRKEISTGVRPMLMGAIMCGFAFVISKVFEYGGKIRAGITLNTNEFYTFYYMFTGIHLLHVFIGIGVLVFIMVLASKERCSSAGVSTIESGAIFWHLVDLLWVVLFALLYLVR